MINFKFKIPGSGMTKELVDKAIYYSTIDKVIFVTDRQQLNMINNKVMNYPNVTVKNGEMSIHSKELDLYNVFVYLDVMPSLDMFKFIKNNNKKLFYRGHRGFMNTLSKEQKEFLIEFYPETVI